MLLNVVIILYTGWGATLTTWPGPWPTLVMVYSGGPWPGLELQDCTPIKNTIRVLQINLIINRFNFVNAQKSCFVWVFLSVDIKSIHAEISGKTNRQLSCVAERSLTPYCPRLPRRSAGKLITVNHRLNYD